MTSTSLLKILLCATLLINPSWAKIDSSVEGLWKTQDGRAKVDIKPCASGSNTVCGKIIQLREPLDPTTGHEKTDQLNPEEKLKNRKLIGMMMLWDFKPESDDSNRWSEGKIYNPREGKTYSAEMEVTEGGKQLSIRGYIGLPIFGQSQIWTRTTFDEKIVASDE